MLYGIVSQKASIEDLFIGGLLPGLLMLGLLAALGVREGLVTQRRADAVPRAGGAARRSWEAKWELLLPVFVVGTFVGGVATLVESAPMAALYTLDRAALHPPRSAVVEGRVPRRGRLRRARRRRAADPRGRGAG